MLCSRHCGKADLSVYVFSVLICLYLRAGLRVKRNLSGKLAIVELSGDFGFAHNSSKRPCTLTSFSHARMPRSACTRDNTCELYCINQWGNTFCCVDTSRNSCQQDHMFTKKLVKKLTSFMLNAFCPL